MRLLRTEVECLAIGLTDDDEHLVRAFPGGIEGTISPDVDEVDDLSMGTGDGNDDLSGFGEYVRNLQAVRRKEFFTATFDVADAKTVGALKCGTSAALGVNREPRTRAWRP